MVQLSLQSANFPDRYVRHRDFLGELTTIETDLDKQDASFVVNASFYPGETVQFESLNITRNVLRHQDYRIKLHEFDPGLGGPNPEQVQVSKDATFLVVKGLHQDERPNALSFQATNAPDRYLRHRDFHLYLEPATDDLARQDATFFAVPAFFVPPPLPPLNVH